MKSSAEIGEIKEFLDKDILTMLNIKLQCEGGRILHRGVSF